MDAFEYQIAKDNFDPLDIIVFRGNDLVSSFICKLEEMTTGSSEWSHVGLLVNHHILPGVSALVPGRWYVWESTISGNLPTGTDGVMDIETGKGFFGTHIRDLEQVVTGYHKMGGKIGLSKLKNNPWNDNNNRSRIIAQFEKLHQRYCHVSYDTNPISLMGSVFPCLRPTRNMVEEQIYGIKYKGYLEKEIAEFEKVPYQITTEGKWVRGTDCRKILRRNRKSEINRRFSLNGIQPTSKHTVKEKLFCSEMIAKFYLLLGILDSRFDCRNVLPTDFFSGTDIDGMPAICEEPIQIIPTFRPIEYSLKDSDWF